jgi:hypothetical protein
MNLEVLQKSRRIPREGDIFVMKPSDGRYLFGRVVNTNANPLGAGGANLIYVYRDRADDKHEIPPLVHTRLLLPPMMTNRQCWLRGYFEHLANAPLDDQQRLPQHCFADDTRRVRAYYDEHGNRLPGPREPCGVFGLITPLGIDKEIAKALGLRRGSREG